MTAIPIFRNLFREFVSFSLFSMLELHGNLMLVRANLSLVRISWWGCVFIVRKNLFYYFLVQHSLLCYGFNFEL